MVTEGAGSVKSLDSNGDDGSCPDRRDRRSPGNPGRTARGDLGGSRRHLDRQSTGEQCTEERPEFPAAGAEPGTLAEPAEDRAAAGVGTDAPEAFDRIMEAQRRGPLERS